MDCKRRTCSLQWQLLCCCFSYLWIFVNGQLKYSIPEELSPGAFVGNIVKDLGLGAVKISDRQLRVVTDSGKQYFQVDSTNGALLVKDRIDRELICGFSLTCSLHLQLLLQNPLELFRVVVEITDVNDNAPQFLSKSLPLEISEAAPMGSKFRLEIAQDLDVGSNGLRSYSLSANEHFALNVEIGDDGSKIPELVIQKALDREKHAAFSLLLTALDGGKPEKSGTATVSISILDVNDNTPVCEQKLKRVRLAENSPAGTLVLRLNASDMDAGDNGQVSYALSKHTTESVRQLFEVDPKTGEIRVKDVIDFEAGVAYDINVQARDKGTPALEGHCNVKVEIIDVNDNEPEVILTSLSSPVSENAVPGTVIALISVRDPDSGPNGEVHLRIPPGVPFKLRSSFENHYSLVTDGPLDREEQNEYNITVTATDSGSPPLSTKIILPVNLSDVNDNAPVFSQPAYTIHLKENNLPGSLICTVSASDADLDKNAQLSFSILDSTTHETSVSSFVYINSENGNIYAMRSFDYEQINLFQIHVQVKDAGSPALSSNATVNVFILDQNDNAPEVVYPHHSDETPLQQTVPRSADAGYLVTKIVAVDADSGHNAWLSYSIPKGKDGGPFQVAAYTGEIRTSRPLQEVDTNVHNVVIVIRDNGQPSLSTSVTVRITVEENGPERSYEFKDSTAKQKNISNLTLYLIIALASVSLVSFLTFVILLVKCLRHSGSHGSCFDSCCSSRKTLRSREAFQRSQKNLHLQLNPDGPIKYVEVVSGTMDSQCYRPCFSPVSDRSDFMFFQTCSPSTPMGNTNPIDISVSSNNLINTANEVRNMSGCV
ncbi:PCDGM protein, partial [Polypterus senegalus]